MLNVLTAFFSCNLFFCYITTDNIVFLLDLLWLRKSLIEVSHTSTLER